MLRQFFQHMVVWHWGYPSDGQLLSLRDGELSNERRMSIQAHLNQCPRCRERAVQIARDWKDFLFRYSTGKPDGRGNGAFPMWFPPFS